MPVTGVDKCEELLYKIKDYIDVEFSGLYFSLITAWQTSIYFMYSDISDQYIALYLMHFLVNIKLNLTHDWNLFLYVVSQSDGNCLLVCLTFNSIE